VGGVHAIDTESAAVSDDLATIATTNLPDGSMLWLHPISAARVVTVKHNAGGAGQIAMKASADLALASPNTWLVVKRTGTDWQEVGQFSPTGTPVVLGAPVVRGAVGARASVTTYTVSSASWIAFYRPSTGGIEKTVTAQGTLTVDAATFARNGRDQSGAFSASSWLYLYYTWDGSTVALRLSTAAPPTGPTLGSGETSWAFIAALRWNGSSNFVNSYLRGRRVVLIAPATDGYALNGGLATTYTAVDLGTLVPPQTVALDSHIRHAMTLSVASGAVVALSATFSVDGVADWHSNQLNYVNGATATTTIFSTPALSVPNINQQYYYKGSGGTNHLLVLGYDNANGG
jgi:hypothetical protein